MTTLQQPITMRERELGAIINAYNQVTDRLKASHERLLDEVTRLREQLEEKNRELARRERLAALGQMAAGVAHEIRNPLAGIQLYAALLVKDLAATPDVCELARKISSGVQTLEGIVGDVLAFAGDAPPQAQRVALADVVRECRAYAAPAIAEHQTILHVADHVADWRLHVDGAQVQRALLNLLLNAIDAAGVGGRVWLSAGPGERDRTCAVAVADDGPGVPAELVDRIFNPFFTTKDSGTGLGLAIVHRIAEAHGGSVRVAERPGGGAVMTLNLPVWAE